MHHVRRTPLAVRLPLVTQQQWGGGPRGGQNPYATQPPPGWGAQGFGQPAYGAYGGPPGQGQRSPNPAGGFGGPQPGVPHYGPPAAARPRRRSPLDVAAARPGGAEPAGDRRSGARQRRHRIVELRVPERQLQGAAAGQEPAADPRAEDLRARPRTGWSTTRFYAQTAPIPVRCNAQPINVANASDAQLESHFDGHDGVPGAGLETAGDGGASGSASSGPRSPSTGRRSPPSAASTGVNAFYCSADQQVYYSNQLPPGGADRPDRQVGRRRGDGARVRARAPGPDGHLGLAPMRWVRTPSRASRRTCSQPAAGDPGRLLLRDVHAIGLALARACSRAISRGDRGHLRGRSVTTRITGEPGIEGNHGLARHPRVLGRRPASAPVPSASATPSPRPPARCAERLGSPPTARSDQRRWPRRPRPRPAR